MKTKKTVSKSKYIADLLNYAEEHGKAYFTDEHGQDWKLSKASKGWKRWLLER